MIYMRVREEVEAFADLMADTYGPLQAAAMDRDLITEMVITDVLADAGVTNDEFRLMDEEARKSLFDCDLFWYIDPVVATGCYSIMSHIGWQVVLRPGLTTVYCAHGSAVDVLRDVTEESFREWVAECSDDARRHHCAFTCK